MTVNVLVVIISLLINDIDQSEGRNSQDPCLIKVFKGLVMTPNSAIVVMITTRSLRYKTFHTVLPYCPEYRSLHCTSRLYCIAWNWETRNHSFKQYC